MTSRLSARGVHIWYADRKVHAIRGVDLDVPDRQVTAFIGPSGCGKSTLLRAFNRMNDTLPGCSQEGVIALDGADIRAPGVDVPGLRRRVGMVFQKPNPFPMSIRDNVAYGLRVGGLRDRTEIAARVRQALEGAALWDEVKDRLADPAMGLSGGQQQRLCIARALAVEPEVLLLDEPTSALDPAATHAVEELVQVLRHRYTVVIVTHNMQQARRISDRTAFFYLGELVEVGDTAQVFEDPVAPRTRAYVAGAFG